MENKTLRFKTNLKCGNCVARVQPVLDGTKGITAWSVDLKIPERILEVDTNGTIEASDIEKILSDAGYKATPCPE